YQQEKDRLANIMINLVEESMLPGLSDMIVMQEASTPLTNVRFTLNTQGAIYGYEQAKENSGFSRVEHQTPIQGLYLASAWSYPGGGFETTILAGKGAFRSMVEDEVLL
ncbi:MAG: hypothetical protein D3916_08505, partial [Candidatus Electrothrix sp. MAN1_4]|nr:hypothetical protein [Candidatus Electrothrix sp. MAN1_4]